MYISICSSLMGKFYTIYVIIIWNHIHMYIQNINISIHNTMDSRICELNVIRITSLFVINDFWIIDYHLLNFYLLFYFISNNESTVKHWNNKNIYLYSCNLTLYLLNISTVCCFKRLAFQHHLDGVKYVKHVVKS